MMDGVDDLAGIIADFQPGPGDASASSSTTSCRAPRRRASSTRRAPCPASPPTCGSSGTPTSTSGSRCARSGSGWQQWPVIPRGTSWKHGICAELGWPHDTQADIARAWKRILGTVRTYADLEPTLLGERRGAHRLRDRAGTLTEPAA